MLEKRKKIHCLCVLKETKTFPSTQTYLFDVLPLLTFLVKNELYDSLYDGI